jgi:O-antigen/teichoic acid export membrane protein
MDILRTGYPLAANTILFWTYRWIGPITVVVAFGSATLGFYSLANAPVVSVVAVLALGGQILLPRFWQQISWGDRHRWIREGDATTSLFLVAGCSAALVGQATFPWFVREFLPHYGPSVLFFAILVIEVPLYLGGQTQSMVLDSVVIGRQHLNLAVMIGVLVTNVVVNVVLVLSHFAAPSIAWADVGVQAAGMVAIFIAARPHQGSFRSRIPTLAPGGIALVIFAAANVVFVGDALGTTSGSTPTGSLTSRVPLAVGAIIVMVMVALVATRLQSRRLHAGSG